MCCVKKIKEVAFHSLVSIKIPKNRWVELLVFKPYKTEINIQNACHYSTSLWSFENLIIQSKICLEISRIHCSLISQEFDNS